MDLVKTDIEILVQQLNQMIMIINDLQNNAYNMRELANRENSVVTDVVPQIKSIVSSMDIMMVSLNSQATIAQATLDRIAVAQ